MEVWDELKRWFYGKYDCECPDKTVAGISPQKNGKNKLWWDLTIQ